MKCQNCGQEIREGYLYCEKCGEEIRIVPDFEPEIENSIIETLSTVAEAIEGKEEKEKKTEDTSESLSAEKDIFFTEEPAKNWMVIRVVSFISILLMAIIVTVVLYFNYSVSYQIDKARKSAAQGDFQTAVKYLDKAIALEDDDAEIILLQANYYYLAKDADKAAEVLRNLIEKSHLETEEAEKAYEYLIALYDEQEKYEEINKLLLECPDNNIVTMFQNYMAMEPEFSYIGGSYDTVIPLKLIANTTGKIYYTLDGSTPTKNSQVYTAPVFLESGSYRVSAFFVNDYGIESKVATSYYEINLTLPDKPQVLLYSGKYDVPTMIEVEETSDGQIYYTTDGSDPTENSLLYTEPVPMPLGRSNFKFVVISEAGVASEIVSRSFELKLNTEVTTDMAIEAVIKALISRDVIKDLQGNAKTEEGKYIFQYNTIVEFEETYYYVLDEYFEDGNGNRRKTGLLYAVEVYTGTPNRLIYDEQGQMGLIPLTD